MSLDRAACSLALAPLCAGVSNQRAARDFNRFGHKKRALREGCRYACCPRVDGENHDRRNRVSRHLNLDDQFVVSETAWRNGGAPARGSAMFAAVNSSIRIEDLIRGLVIVSGNDAAIALAEGIAGSEGAFATQMTKRARELGLERATFTRRSGTESNPARNGDARQSRHSDLSGILQIF
jgi:D-alanyl-D-alanine carboxypeptidase